MNLYNRIEREHADARRRGDVLVLNTLGMLKSELVNATKMPGAAPEVDDQLVHRVALKALKQREEAAAAFFAAGRPEPAARERAEADVLRSYLPPPASASELEAEVRAILAEVQPQGPGGFGQVMKEATRRLGARAEGREIAAVVRRLLG